MAIDAIISHKRLKGILSLGFRHEKQGKDPSSQASQPLGLPL
jgi:hypothetical protein